MIISTFGMSSFKWKNDCKLQLILKEQIIKLSAATPFHLKVIISNEYIRKIIDITSKLKLILSTYSKKLIKEN